jgi:hypothetical protein
MSVKVTFRKTDAGESDSSSLSVAPPVPPKDVAVPPKVEVVEVPCERTRKPEDVKILLAEDNALIREIVTKTLKKMKVRSVLLSLPSSILKADPLCTVQHFRGQRRARMRRTSRERPV